MTWQNPHQGGVYNGIFEPQEVIRLRRNYPAVYRLRESANTTKVKVCPKTKEELWVVGDMTMTHTEMMALARSI